MALNVSLDENEIARGVQRLVRDLGMTAQKAVRWQMLLWLRDLMHELYPHGQTQGSRKVRSDISRAVRVFDPESRIVAASTSEGVKRLATLARRRDYAGLNAVVERATGKMRHWKIVSFTPELHRSVRLVPRYNVRRNTRVFTLDKRQWNEYVKKMVGRVGSLKGGFAHALLRLGGSVPAWVRRHSALGRMQDDSGNADATIVADNLVKHGPAIAGRVADRVTALRAKRVHEYVDRQLKLLAKRNSS